MRPLKHVALWALLLCLGACSIAPSTSIPPELQQRLPAQHEITATPFFVQDDYQCGPAALAMVLHYYQHPRTPQQLTPWLFTPDAKGSFPAELDAVSRQEGFISYPVNTLDALLQEVAADHPVIVLQNLGTDWYTRWHFAVVIGYDLEQRHVILRSGDLARRITPMDVFDRTWHRSQRWGRAVLPPTDMPVTAERLPYLKAASDLEQTGPLDAAEQAYRTSLRQWPEAPLARFGLGNILLQQHRNDEAVREFQQLLALEPAFAAGWNNYGYALRGVGCPASALRAVQCASLLMPQNADIAASVTELQTIHANAAHCPVIQCPLPL